MQYVRAAIRAHARACTKGSRLVEKQQNIHRILTKDTDRVVEREKCRKPSSFLSVSVRTTSGISGKVCGGSGLPGHESVAFCEAKIALSVLSPLHRAYKTIEDDDLKFPLIYGEGKKVRCARRVALQARAARLISAHRTPSGNPPLSPRPSPSHCAKKNPLPLFPRISHLHHPGDVFFFKC